MKKQANCRCKFGIQIYIYISVHMDRIPVGFWRNRIDDSMCWRVKWKLNTQFTVACETCTARWEKFTPTKCMHNYTTVNEMLHGIRACELFGDLFYRRTSFIFRSSVSYAQSFGPAECWCECFCDDRILTVASKKAVEEKQQPPPYVRPATEKCRAVTVFFFFFRKKHVRVCAVLQVGLQHSKWGWNSGTQWNEKKTAI